MNAPATTETAPTRPAVYTLAIRSKAALYSAWMPLIKGGGLFVPSAQPPKLGDDVLLVITLLEEPERIAAHGKVVWLNPANSSGPRPSGFAVQLPETEACKAFKHKVESLIAGALSSSRPTHTL